MGTISLGNDVSSYQGDIDFATYKNNSQFVLAKATEGRGFIDPKFKRNQEQARGVGLVIGFYHFARSDLGNTPESEADYFLNLVGQLKEGELLALDYECPNQVQAHVDWCKKWLDYVYSKTKVKPFIYLNQSQVKKFDWKSVIDAGYGLWIAAYLGNPHSPLNNNFDKGQWQFAAMQQWTNGQKVPGIPVDRADGNVFFGDLVTLKKYGYKPEAPLPPPTDWEAKYNEQLVINKAQKLDLDKATNTASELTKRLFGIKDFTAKA